MKKLDTNWLSSGLGGLTAATRLARARLRVLVIEQHVFAGGYAHHFLRKVKGTDIVYHFDVALHQTGSLKPGLSMDRMLRGLGIRQRIELNQFTSRTARAARLTTCRFLRTPMSTRRC